METLISDSNRSIGTLAITTLLKTGDESSVDRLMKQVDTHGRRLSTYLVMMMMMMILHRDQFIPYIHERDLTPPSSSLPLLYPQISTFMNDIADEFKILIVTSIKQLCLKFPQKQGILVGFLANFLREEGGFEYKKVRVGYARLDR